MRTIHYFKSLLASALFFSALALIPGCKQRPDTISSSLIVKQANQQLQKQVQDQRVASIRIGQYEANDAERAQLRKLAAAGLVTYKVTRYAWWEKSRVDVRKAVTVTKSLYNIWTYKDTEYRTVKSDNYEFCDHYVVDIALTKEGERLLIDRLEAEEEEDKDLVEPEVDPSKYIWNQKDLSEYWPEIENPFIEKKASTVNVSSNQESGESSGKVGKSGKSTEPEKVTRIDSLQYQAFYRLPLECQGVHLLAYNIQAVKARNIQIYEENGFPKCKAEVIYTTKNVTDAGRIFYEVENGMKDLETVDLDYFIDKGWILNPHADYSEYEDLD